MCWLRRFRSSPFPSSERIHISTPNKYEYQYVKKPARMTHFQVAVKTHNDAHIALSPSPHDSAEMLEVVLGGRQNTRSWVSLGKMGEQVASAPTPGILSWDEFRSFWISWRRDVLQVRAWLGGGRWGGGGGSEWPRHCTEQPSVDVLLECKP